MKPEEIIYHTEGHSVKKEQKLRCYEVETRLKRLKWMGRSTEWAECSQQRTAELTFCQKAGEFISWGKGKSIL